MPPALSPGARSRIPAGADDGSPPHRARPAAPPPGAGGPAAREFSASRGSAAASRRRAHPTPRRTRAPPDRARRVRAVPPKGAPAARRPGRHSRSLRRTAAPGRAGPSRRSAIVPAPPRKRIPTTKRAAGTPRVHPTPFPRTSRNSRRFARGANARPRRWGRVAVPAPPRRTAPRKMPPLQPCSARWRHRRRAPAARSPPRSKDRAKTARPR